MEPYGLFRLALLVKCRVSRFGGQWKEGGGILARQAGIAVLLLLLGGCSDPIETLSGPTMGSQYSLKYVAGRGVPQVAVVKVEVERMLGEVDQQMSTWRADSDISRFNQLPAGQCLGMPEPVLKLVRFGEQMSRESDGAFDLTVAPLLNLWGFGPQSRRQQVPGPKEIAAVLARTGHQHVRIEGQRLCKDVAAEIDLGSIAAGYTVDTIGDRLAELGISSYVLNVTGELRVVGRKPDGSPWMIAIESPFEGKQTAERVLPLDGMGLSTSGDYHNYFERDGVRYSHTFDPRRGAPIDHQLASVTVLDPSTLRAEGLSTALLVLGPEQGFDYAERNGVLALFISRGEQGFSSRMTSTFEARFGAATQP